MSIVNASGTFVLFFSNIIGKIFGAIYRLPLSNLLGAEGMGLYQMAFPVYSFLLTLITGGISVHLTRVVAKYRAKDNNAQIYKEFVLARNVSIIFGFIFLIFLLVFAYPISYMQGNVNAVYGYFAIAFGFIFAVMLGAYRGYYQGFGNMKPTAISQVIEQASKLIFGLLFAYVFMQYGIKSGVFGALLGISFSEFLSFIYFLIINRKNLTKQKVVLQKTDYKSFIKQVAPVSFSYMILPFSALIDSFLVVNLLSFGGFTSSFATSMYGIQTGMILPLINLPNVLVGALALACIPEISYKLNKNQNITKEVCGIFKLVFMFILPCSIGMFVLARPIITNIFVNLNAELIIIAINLLRFSAIQMFFLCFLTITNSLLQALNQVKLPAITMLLGIITKIVLTILFVSNAELNIYGLVLATTLGYFVTALLNVVYIKKYTSFRLKLLEIVAPIIASLFMTVGLLLIIVLSSAKINLILLILTIGVGVVIYFACLFALKQLSFTDLKKALQIKRN
ncbi:MAG: polysaccharide biosynthesis protein [Clostridiales bacterium]|nr:polysaccharide biosynthesis protein [Clostridiales bacterium]